MLDYLKQLSLMPKGLRYKTMIAFSLMSLIPLLVCVWLVTSYIFPNIGLMFGLSLGNISLILFISIVIALLGLYLTKEMIDPVIRMAGDAKDIAEGAVDKVIGVEREDEIGDLGASLNIMTKKIRENIEELKEYGEKTKLINIEINKRVLVLSSLLQIGNLIASSTELDTVIEFIVRKVSDVEDRAVSLIMLLDEEAGEFKVAASNNINEDRLMGFGIPKNKADEKMVVVDKNTPASSEMQKGLLALLDVKNVAMLPIVVAKVQYGILIIGNKDEGFELKYDVKEILKIFMKQAAIAVENDLLLRKAKELAVKDDLTGLYNQSYIQTRLDEEIKRAVMYQRPCGYLLIDIDGFKDHRDKIGERKAETLLKTTAEILKGQVSDVDKVARLNADRFAVVLPEKNKKQSATTAEDIRKKVEEALYKIMKMPKQITVSVGVSENPIDGSTAGELMAKAEQQLKHAKSLGKNRVGI